MMDPSQETPAIRAATAADVPFTIARTDRPSSVEESAALQGIEVRQLVRTIVVRLAAHDYVFVLVPGGRQIDWQRLRSHLGQRRLSLPDEAEARRATGYGRGAITPFGSARAWRVVADSTIMDAELVAIGGGARGVNLHLAPADLIRAVRAEMADVTRPSG